jgi:hypothetical protein
MLLDARILSAPAEGEREDQRCEDDRFHKWFL